MNKEFEKQLERTHNKNILMDRVFSEIRNDEELQAMIKDSGCDIKMTNKVLAFMAIYKRLPIATLLAMIYKPNGSMTLEETARELENIYEHDFMHYDSDDGRFIVRFELDNQVQQEIDAFQFPLPLMVKPKLLRHNMASAYYTKSKQSVLLKNLKTKADLNLDHLNLMNQTAFSINETVLKKAVNKWKSDEDQTMTQINRFNKYCKIIYKLIIENGNKFYFSHRYCYRGRTYNVGYYANYQGNDFCKSILEFAHKEYID